MSAYQFKNIIKIPFNSVELEGELSIPKNSESLVIFSHGSGSSRFSPRNNFVAKIFNEHGISTYLVDLLTKKEDEVYANRFNIDLLTERLIHVTKHLADLKETSKLRIGYFGASTGAASAMKAASLLPKIIHAIVSRGGRPDLALSDLKNVEAPTLLIVGSLDYEVIKLNQLAYHQMQCTKNLEIIKGATHLFEESGALQEVANISKDWFSTHFMVNKKQLVITI